MLMKETHKVGKRKERGGFEDEIFWGQTRSVVFQNLQKVSVLLEPLLLLQLPTIEHPIITSLVQYQGGGGGGVGGDPPVSQATKCLIHWANIIKSQEKNNDFGLCSEAKSI